jgi:hypothetical protein
MWLGLYMMSDWPHDLRLCVQCSVVLYAFCCVHYDVCVSHIFLVVCYQCTRDEWLTMLCGLTLSLLLQVFVATWFACCCRWRTSARGNVWVMEGQIVSVQLTRWITESTHATDMLYMWNFKYMMFRTCYIYLFISSRRSLIHFQCRRGQATHLASASIGEAVTVWLKKSTDALPLAFLGVTGPRHLDHCAMTSRICTAACYCCRLSHCIYNFERKGKEKKD